jgi:hypothetical protein
LVAKYRSICFPALRLVGQSYQRLKRHRDWTKPMTIGLRWASWPETGDPGAHPRSCPAFLFARRGSLNWSGMSASMEMFGQTRASGGPVAVHSGEIDDAVSDGAHPGLFRDSSSSISRESSTLSRLMFETW